MTFKEFDRRAVHLMYTHVIAGACFSIGLRFAGTGSRKAAVASKLRIDAEGHSFYYVKRWSGHLNYKQDPDSKRSLLVQTGIFQGRDPLNLVMLFTDDQRILAFAKYFCGIAASGVSSSSAATNVLRL
jgi:hypothetical protein